MGVKDSLKKENRIPYALDALCRFLLGGNALPPARSGSGRTARRVVLPNLYNRGKGGFLKGGGRVRRTHGKKMTEGGPSGRESLLIETVAKRVLEARVGEEKSPRGTQGRVLKRRGDRPVLSCSLCPLAYRRQTNRSTTCGGETVPRRKERRTSMRTRTPVKRWVRSGNGKVLGEKKKTRKP